MLPLSVWTPLGPLLTIAPGTRTIPDHVSSADILLSSRSNNLKAWDEQKSSTCLKSTQNINFNIPIKIKDYLINLFSTICFSVLIFFLHITQIIQFSFNICVPLIYLFYFLLLVPSLSWKEHWITSCLKGNLHLLACFLVWFVRKHFYSLSRVITQIKRQSGVMVWIFKKKKVKDFSNYWRIALLSLPWQRTTVLQRKRKGFFYGQNESCVHIISKNPSIYYQCKDINWAASWPLIHFVMLMDRIWRHSCAEESLVWKSQNSVENISYFHQS